MNNIRKNGCAGACCESFVLHAGENQIDAETAGVWRLNLYRGVWGAWKNNSADQVKTTRAFMSISKDRFTCSWFDSELKMCGDYENRPETCRKFGRQCSKDGCTYGRKSNGNNA